MESGGYDLVKVISIAETLVFCPSPLVTSSVQMLIACSCKSFRKALLNNSTVSTALLIARPLALTTTFFAQELKNVRQAIT
jgi:hypothetical protein